jgi:hypothetical protein
VSNGWSDDSIKDLLTLFKDMLPLGNTVPKTVYEAKQNALFVDSTDSIIEKTVVTMRTATEEKADLKMCFGTLLSFLI